MTTNNDQNDSLKSIANIDKIIHEPARLMILSFLYVVDHADFTFTLNQTGMTRGNLSTHMSKLENAGYIEVSKKFLIKRPLTIFKLSKKGRKSFEKYQVELQALLDRLQKNG
ncbi:MAG: transcriptional regulator [Chloroflexi bacterium]|jgi:DNA-binding MarR family transcriptional regulator|nr:transcriptional regulator [Chloroflexota bacterium]MBT4003962.1 transcriptional regulator [Chloroflexota bacterium]MBT4305732.1 transcriptional regulator [Chloroflexota bacterium]MBT4533556.1 transcriptional regulator [Chloroflexota bacterium]MBT4681801.1 transcriptional regulator [Chloroflexota bacterium]